MTHPYRLLVVLCCSAVIGGAAAHMSASAPAKRPDLVLKATPAVGFSPARVRVNADLKGGTDDFQELYCPKVEWDWGDGTTSEASSDCEPYQEGKSEINRHYTVYHVFDMAGNYRVMLRLKQKERVVASGTVIVQIRPGVREMDED